MSADPENPLRPKMLDFSLILTIAISALAINVAVPSIPLTQTALGGRVMDGHYIMTAFLLGYALGHIPFGLLADRYGRKTILLAGLLLFTLGGLASSFAVDIPGMLWARFVQGLGGAAGPVIVRAMARDLTSGPALSALMTKLMNSLAFIPLIAPLLGSAILSFYGWRGPYIFSWVLGVVSFIVIFVFVPETQKPGAVPAAKEHRLRKSFVLFITHRESLWGAGLLMALFFGYLGMMSGIASVLHDVYGFKGPSIGWIVGALLLPYAGSATYNRMAARTGFLKTPRSIQSLLRLGVYFFIGAVGLAIVALFLPIVPLWLFFAVIVIYLIGMGLSFANVTVIALTGQAKTAGFAAGIMGSVQIGAGALGSWGAAAFYNQSSFSLLLMMLLAATSFVAIYYGGVSSGNTPAQKRVGQT
ncbi:MAG: hypothetical protein COA84_07450 [Robiginitomaculum sp.]|nr:MAG: hypothetical protein COA84_07450 [Robiginitomaculum sp.]